MKPDDAGVSGESGRFGAFELLAKVLPETDAVVGFRQSIFEPTA